MQKKKRRNRWFVAAARTPIFKMAGKDTKLARPTRPVQDCVGDPTYLPLHRENGALSHAMHPDKKNREAWLFRWGSKSNWFGSFKTVRQTTPKPFLFLYVLRYGSRVVWLRAVIRTLLRSVRIFSLCALSIVSVRCSIKHKP